MIIGSRESKLAMRQTELFIAAAEKVSPGIETKVVGIKSLGDIDLKSPLHLLDNVGAFVRELDDAMLQNLIDISVNSLKDIPIDVAPGLVIGAVMKRDATEDVILPCKLEDLPEGAVIGTASVRRMALLNAVRPDIKTISLRGNIHTRLEKLDNGECDAIILAKAGLDRMGIERPMFSLDPKVFVPAPAQGAIAIECRENDSEMIELLDKIEDKTTRIAVDCERAIMKALKAGCSSPVGISATLEGNNIKINAVSFMNGETRVETTLPINYSDKDIDDIAERLGKKE